MPISRGGRLSFGISAQPKIIITMKKIKKGSRHRIDYSSHMPKNPPDSVPQETNNNHYFGSFQNFLLFCILLSSCKFLSLSISVLLIANK
jgi:hypothetical protein